MKNKIKIMACMALALAALALSAGCASTGSTTSTGGDEIIPGTTVTKAQYAEAYKRLHGGNSVVKNRNGNDMQKHLRRGANAYYGAID